MDNLPPQLNPQDPKQPGFPDQSTPPPPPVPEVVAQPQQPKKKSFLKIFAILAVFLFLVLASELAYYFATTKRKEAGQEPLTAKIPEQFQPDTSTPTPTPTPAEEDIFGGALNLAKIDEFIGLFADYTKSIYQKGEITLVSVGRVIEISIEKDATTQTITLFEIKMQSQTAPTDDFGIIVRDDPEDVITVFIARPGGQRNQAILEDIKEGDIIKLTQTFNILDKPAQDLVIIEVERGDEG